MKSNYGLVSHHVAGGELNACQLSHITQEVCVYLSERMVVYAFCCRTLGEEGQFCSEGLLAKCLIIVVS